jgi:hypothetical protein
MRPHRVIAGVLSVLSLVLVTNAAAQEVRVVSATAFSFPKSPTISGNIQFAIKAGIGDKLDRYRIEVADALDQSGNKIIFSRASTGFEIPRGGGEVMTGASFSAPAASNLSIKELTLDLITYSPARVPESSFRVDQISEKLGSTLIIPGAEDVKVQLKGADDFITLLSDQERKNVAQIVATSGANAFGVVMEDPRHRIVSYRLERSQGSGGSGGFYGGLNRRLFYSSLPLTPDTNLTFLIYNSKAESRKSISLRDIQVKVQR